MSGADRNKWNQRYRAGSGDAVPARVLAENRHLLPAVGTALEMACGLGGNALLMANRGLDTVAWDISQEAISRLEMTAGQQGVSLVAQVRDVVADPPQADAFDVIVVSRFLHRDLAGAIQRALKPGGLLFYQTFTRDRVNAGGPSNPAFCLGENELLSLFAGLTVLV